MKFNFIKKVLRLTSSNYGWFGDYDSWERASNDCKGYDHQDIIDSVFNSALKVKNGEIVYERDSITSKMKFNILGQFYLFIVHN